jgi:hypothetical protein
MPFPRAPGKIRVIRVTYVTVWLCCSTGNQPDAVKYFKKNLIREHFYFRMLLRVDLACATSQLAYSQIRDAISYVPISLWLLGLRKSVTMRPSFRVTSSRNVRPASEDMRRIALIAVMTTPEDNPLTIVSCTDDYQSTPSCFVNQFAPSVETSWTY